VRDAAARIRTVPTAILTAIALVVGACGSGPVATESPTSPPPTVVPATLAPTATTVAETTAPTATIAPTPVPTPFPGGCLPDDVKASHGLVEGAAGSRITQVVLVSAVDCSVDAFPALAVRDANGAPLVEATPAGPGRIDLVAGIAYESAARIANWCGVTPAYPLELELRLGPAEVPVTGTSFPSEGDMPPCTADGGPILEGTAWTPAP